MARRARERPELALRALLRHRLDAGQAGADGQGAAADPRRSVRRWCSNAASCSSASATARCMLHYFDRALPLDPRRGRRAAQPRRSSALRERAGRRRRRICASSSASSRRCRTCRRRPNAMPDEMAERHREKEVARERLAAARRARRRTIARAHRARDRGVERHSRAIRAASIGCTSCSTRRPTGWPTGGRRRTRSTTAASSTSTSWPASAWKTRRCSRPRTA